VVGGNLFLLQLPGKGKGVSFTRNWGGGGKKGFQIRRRRGSFFSLRKKIPKKIQPGARETCKGGEVPLLLEMKGILLGEGKGLCIGGFAKAKLKRDRNQPNWEGKKTLPRDGKKKTRPVFSERRKKGEPTPLRGRKTTPVEERKGTFSYERREKKRRIFSPQ